MLKVKEQSQFRNKISKIVKIGKPLKKYVLNTTIPALCSLTRSLKPYTIKIVYPIDYCLVNTEEILYDIFLIFCMNKINGTIELNYTFYDSGHPLIKH